MAALAAAAAALSTPLVGQAPPGTGGHLRNSTPVPTRTGGVDPPAEPAELTVEPPALEAAAGKLLDAADPAGSAKARARLRDLAACLRREAHLEGRMRSIEAGLAEAEAEVIRARATGEYANYEDRSRRIEERDIAHRLSMLLAADRQQAGRELARLRRVNRGGDPAVAAEAMERAEKRVLGYGARLDSLEAEIRALDDLRPASRACESAAGRLAAYHDRRLDLLAVERDALGEELTAARAWSRAESCRLLAALDRLAGEAELACTSTSGEAGLPHEYRQRARSLVEAGVRVGGGEDPLAGAPEKCRALGPAIVSAYLHWAALALRAEAASAHRELLAFERGIAADLAAIEFESEALGAALLFDSYIVGRIAAYIERLDARARLTEAQLAYARNRAGRDIAVTERGLGNPQVAERASRVVDHLEHASQRSSSDQAALRRLVAAMESVSRADEASRPALEAHRAAAAAALEFAGSLAAASWLGQWSPPLLPGGPATTLEAAGEKVDAARRELAAEVAVLLAPMSSPRDAVADRLSRSLGHGSDADAGRFVPLRTLSRYSSNDPSPIQIRGPDNILRSALTPKGAEMQEWRREAESFDPY